MKLPPSAAHLRTRKSPARSDLGRVQTPLSRTSDSRTVMWLRPCRLSVDCRCFTMRGLPCSNK